MRFDGVSLECLLRASLIVLVGGWEEAPRGPESVMQQPQHHG